MTKNVLRLAPLMVVLAASAPIAAAKEPMLVDAAWLAEHLHDSNLVLLHVGDKKEFDEAHIPGAQFIALSDISDPTASLKLELPAVDILQRAFESRGISNNSR